MSDTSELDEVVFQSLLGRKQTQNLILDEKHAIDSFNDKVISHTKNYV